MGRQTSTEPPQETDPPQLSDPPKAATGLPAVLKTLEVSLQEMGPLRSLTTLGAVNQLEGFDCPSCAWGDPHDRHLMEFCENGAKAVASEATTKRITPEFFKQWSVADLARQSDHWLGTQGRLTHPMLLPEGGSHYEPIPWPEAFRVIADELNALHSPDEAIFYTSGRTSNEAAFLYQLFVRMFGTNNMPDCSNMCHESSGFGLRETIGVGKSTVTLEDLENTDCIFIIGQNPGTNHPRMLSSLQTAVNRGAIIVSINPLPEVGLMRFKHPQQLLSMLGPGTQLSKLHLQVRVNGDVALLKGIMKCMVEAGALDHDFIRDYTSGFEEFTAHLNSIAWPGILEESGVPKEQIEEAARIAIAAESTVVCWAMGLTQHKNAVGNVRELVNFLLLRGNIGRPRAGVCCVRGHSNVQGDRTMGIWEQMDEDFLRRLSREFHFEAPRNHGYNTVESINAMHEGRARIFISMGGNFLSATPDTAYTADALRNCKLTVQISTKLNRSHLITGKRALILPCLGRTEIDRQASGIQFVTVENTFSVVSASRGVLEPASPHLLSEPAIVANMAKATLGQDWDHLIADYGRIRDHIAHVVKGCEDYDAKVKQPGGFQLDIPAARRVFNTNTGKANFTINPVPGIPLRQGEYLMMTIRTHDQFNTTIYGLDDRYRGIHNGRHVIFLNAGDMDEAGLSKGQWVDIVSSSNGTERVAHRFAAVPYSIPRKCAAAYYPETNVLVPIDSFAEKSMTPASKSIVVTLRPC